MNTISVIKPSFAAGELSPLLYGRVDLAKYQVGVRTMRNFFVHPQGGASNRPGTRFVGEVADSAVRHRLIPFQFRTAPAGQTYVLVFGPYTMQVAMMGEEGPGFVESAPGVRFTLATPYAAADLARLKYVQSADTMTLTHPGHAPRSLTRTGHAAWRLDPLTFAPRTAAPAGLAAVSGGGGSAFVVVTALNDGTGEESLPSAEAGAASATSGSWGWSAVAGCSSYNVYKKKGSIFGFVAQVSTPNWTDDNIAPDIGVTPPQQRQPFGYGRATGVTIQAGGAGYSSPSGMLHDGGRAISAVSFTVSGGTITAGTLAAPNQKVSDNAYITVTDGAGSGAVLQPQWTDDGSGNGTSYISGVTVIAGGAGYHAGCQVHSYYAGIVDYGGYVFGATLSGGAITAVTVAVTGYGAWPADGQAMLTLAATDASGSGGRAVPAITPDEAGNPQCSSYYQQRQVFAGTTSQPQTLWFSSAGAFNNMAVSQPTRDSDAITRTLTGRQVNEIRHLVPVGQNLLAMSSGAEWRCWPGPTAAALTPASCATLPQTGFGCSHVPPLQADNAILFVQERGSRVRELRFDMLQDQYQASDLSVLSSHLLADTTAAHAIEEWALCEEPFRIVWAVRSDGTLLGLTWMREHEVQAWHRHDTGSGGGDGAVESVASIAEAAPSAGDGAPPSPLGDALYLIVRREVNGTTRRYLERLAERRFATLADAWFLDCALAYRGPATTTLTGLGHLEGKAVTVLADGVPAGPFTVSGGAVALATPCTTAIAGLPYRAELETLDLDLPTASGTAQGKLKKISRLTVRVKDSCGLQAGPDAAALRGIGDDWGGEAAGAAFTGDWPVTMPGEWTRGGRLLLRQDRPLPCTVLAVIPEVTIGG